MMDIALFYMAGYKYGGFPTFTQQLMKSFESFGYTVGLYKVRNRTETHTRDFGCDCEYRNLHIDDAVEIVGTTPSIITCTEYKKDSDNIDAVLKAGAHVVIHDWTEMERGFDSVLLENAVEPIVIRKPNVDMLANFGVGSTFIQHPYIPFNLKDSRRHMKAISLARLDWDKNTHMIVEANERLSQRNKIYMWGSNHNRIYLYNKISEFEGWETQYYTGPCYFGPFPAIDGFAVLMASNAEFFIDMSVIKGDGGGTQYSFLEGIDAGAIVVLHKDWLLEGGVFEAGRNCMAVGTVDELVDLVENEKRRDHMELVEDARTILDNHVPGVVVPKYVDKLGL